MIAYFRHCNTLKEGNQMTFIHYLLLIMLCLGIYQVIDDSICEFIKNKKDGSDDD